MTMKPPVRLLRTTASKPLVEMLLASARYWPPALLTSPSMRPVAARIASTVAITAASSRMSQGWMVARPPSSMISARTRSSLSGLRPTSATSAPSAASSCAVQRPMPLPPPVTIMVWPENRPGAKTDR
jgi:hypothetical protein